MLYLLILKFSSQSVGHLHPVHHSLSVKALYNIAYMNFGLLPKKKSSIQYTVIDCTVADTITERISNCLSKHYSKIV